MKEKQAIAVFTALSQETRLGIVRLLVAAGSEGMAAGAIGEAMSGKSSSRMSFHLSHLEHAGLIEARREGRSIIYSTALPALSSLMEFFIRECCQEHPDVCGPTLAVLESCCELDNGTAKKFDRILK